MAVWVGTIKKGGLIDRIWHAGNKLIYRRAEHTIVLCESAKKLVCENYGLDPNRVHVIYNWADANELRPKPKSESAFAKEHGLIDPFTVLNKPCSVTAAVKFESIFIGNKISLQVKLYEVVVRPQDKSVRGLLRPNASRPTQPTVAPTIQPIEVNLYNHLGEESEEEEEEEEVVSKEEEEEEDEGSILGEENEEIVIAPPEPVAVAPEPAPKKTAKPRGKKSG
jgi:hypothetical protein